MINYLDLQHVGHSRGPRFAWGHVIQFLHCENEMSFRVCLAHMSLDRKGVIHFFVFSKAKGPGDPLDYIAATETSSPLQERQRFQRRVRALQN